MSKKGASIFLGLKIAIGARRQWGKVWKFWQDPFSCYHHPLALYPAQSIVLHWLHCQVILVAPGVAAEEPGK